MLSIEEICNTKDLEGLFKKIIRNNDIIKQIRNFGPLKYDVIKSYLQDKKVLEELKKYGRHSILKKITLSKD